MNREINPPARRLKGHLLNDRWMVGDIVEAEDPRETVGKCSVSYECSDRNGTPVFLKVMDYSQALGTDDPPLYLNLMTKAHLFERSVLESCRSLSRIVTSLDHGSYNVDESDITGFSTVQFIVFELAEKSVSTTLVSGKRPPLHWCIKIIHNVSVGLRQLHNAEIAHQDLKPGNVLEQADGSAKIADLGSAQTPTANILTSVAVWPGTPHYAPPEIQYEYLDADFRVRRVSTDLYLLGSFILSVLTGLHMSAWLFHELDDSLKPKNLGGPFKGTYPEVKDYVATAFEDALLKIEQRVGKEPDLLLNLLDMVRELCHPDPFLRGDPKTRRNAGSEGNRFELERYLARIDRLRMKAEIYDRSRS